MPQPFRLDRRFPCVQPRHAVEVYCLPQPHEPPQQPPAGLDVTVEPSRLRTAANNESTRWPFALPHAGHEILPAPSNRGTRRSNSFPQSGHRNSSSGMGLWGDYARFLDPASRHARHKERGRWMESNGLMTYSRNFNHPLRVPPASSERLGSYASTCRRQSIK
jgi:hypothetical protein